jgi:hypothetical protein
MLFLSHKTVSTERAQHTEIPLPRDKELLRHASSSPAAVFVLPRAATWYRLCEVKQRTFLTWEPRAIDIRLYKYITQLLD